MKSYEVVVGNVGTVYYGSDKEVAQNRYDAYVVISKDHERNRAYGEDVTMFVHSESMSDIEQEHNGHLFNGDGYRI